MSTHPNHDLATVEQHLATRAQQPQREPTTGELLAAVITQGITPSSVEVMERLCALREREQNRTAEREFAESLAALQSETIRVAATKKVDEKPDGTCRYRFAPYEEIMAVCQPILTRHGFSITFDTEIAGDGSRLTSICTLTHKSGHSRSNKFAVRFGKPPGSSDAQGDMSTKSYAKRGALCDALNISIDHDDDARNVGETITKEQAVAIYERVLATGGDAKKFLAFAGAVSFDSIGTAALPRLEKMLAAKEKATQPNQ